MTLRNYQPSDCRETARLFYETVHTINARDYTREQLDAWAPENQDLGEWNRRFLEHRSVVAVDQGQILGFGDLAPDGYLDRLFVHKDFQRQGIASAICQYLEQDFAGTITTHASITAKPFFLARGYQVVREQQVCCRSVWMTNYVMEKREIVNKYQMLCEF